MATANFHDRIARLHAKYDANPIPKAEMAPHIEDVEKALAKKSKKAARPTRKMPKLLALPLLFLIGLIVPVFAGMVMFHLFPEHGGAVPAEASLVLVILDDIGIGLVVSGIVMILLTLSGLWLALIAYGAGTYLAIFHEMQLMALFPEIWAMMYSPSYVVETLDYARQMPAAF